MLFAWCCSLPSYLYSHSAFNHVTYQVVAVRSWLGTQIPPTNSHFSLPHSLLSILHFFFQARFHFQFYDAAYLRPSVVTCISDKFSQPKIWWWLFFTLKETSNQQSFGALSTNQTWRGAGIYQLYPQTPSRLQLSWYTTFQSHSLLDRSFFQCDSVFRAVKLNF